MKKLTFIISALLLILLVSCDGNVKISTPESTDAAETSVEQTTADLYTDTTSVADHIHTPEEAYMKSTLAHYKSCSICAQIIEQGNHTYGDWSIIKEATEKEDGIKEKACTVCGYNQSEAIPMLSHVHTFSTSWTYDADSHYNVCSCGEKDKSAAHTFSEWKITKEATEQSSGAKERSCSVCGYTEKATIAALSHTHKFSSTYMSDGTSHWFVCSCGEKSEVAAHAFNDWVTTIASTCLKTGSKSRSCTLCGKTETSTVAKLSHSFSEWIEVKAPNCTEKGSDKRICSLCSTAETRSVNSLGHKTVTVAGKAATCTETGLTEGSYCSICNAVLIAQKTVGLANHQYITKIVAPTKKEGGYTQHTCSICGQQYTDTYTDPTGSVGLAYTVNSDKKSCTITGMGKCTDTEVIIPSNIDTYTVTDIAEKAFADCTSITFIYIPNTVKTIGNRAFYNCSSLTETNIPQSVTSIGTQIFYKAKNINSLTYDSSNSCELGIAGLEKITFNGTSIPSDICKALTKLKEVRIGLNVETIGYSAFYGCTGLTSVTIPDSVTYIGHDAFSGCSGLTSVTIPDSVTSIGYSTFYGCSSLTSINILDRVTSIGFSAFYECSSLTSIAIPNSVTSIGNGAFEGCSGLTSVIIPDSVTIIRERAFNGCTALTSVTIPDSVTNIESEAFNRCSGLTSITIPDSVTSIEYGAFWYCQNLKSITYTGTKEQWNSISKANIGPNTKIICTDGEIIF